MSQGLVIQNQLKQVEKSKKEPLICWNCQGYGHRATACTRPATCGNCAKEGHTGKPHASPCPEPFNKKCACCGKIGHGSFEWQYCQLQQSKRQDWKKWNPDADSPLFDSLKSPWMLGVKDNTPAAALAYRATYRAPPSTGANSIGIVPRYKPPSQRAAKDAYKGRRRELPGPSPSQ
ncbi:hypothetical protein NMY22_g13742 [Coprinellus aureogranulatus]|nr:hypothetical protein NMY22_g13742 [Coprinellus aureogranulatus]